MRKLSELVVGAQRTKIDILKKSGEPQLDNILKLAAPYIDYICQRDIKYWEMKLRRYFRAKAA